MTEDAAVVDEIIASAEADAPEGRLERLEKEVNLLKGSIKRLLLDIRETMNNLENPFQNLAKLAESGFAQPQAVQVIPAPVEIKEKKEEEEEEKEEKAEKEEEKREEEEKKVEERIEDVKHVEPEKEVGGVKPEEGVEVATVTPKVSEVTKLTKYDIITLYELMEWVRGMLEKYDAQSLKTMLDVFEIAGYISGEAKEFITKLVDLMSINNGFEDMLLELYRLHKIMHPSDTSMDSKLLNLLLEKRL